MPNNDSQTSGALLNGIPDYALWKSNEEGFVVGKELYQEPNHILAMEYLEEKKFFGLSDDAFCHARDCYYKKNHCHIENRNGARFIRPSCCSKFMLKSGEEIIKEQLQPGNPKQKWLPTYHGTHPDNMASILANGLLIPGSTLGGSSGQTVQMKHGNAYGTGVYTTMMPLYAQLYAAPEVWNGLYVQTFLMLCQSPDTLKQGTGNHGSSTRSILARSDVHKLYGGFVAEDEVQFVTTDPSQFVICAIMIKIHATNPTEKGGEFHEVEKLLEKIDSAMAKQLNTSTGSKHTK